MILNRNLSIIFSDQASNAFSWLTLRFASVCWPPTHAHPLPRQASLEIRDLAVKARHSTLGSLLRSLRLRNRWTLKEMSQRTDIPVSTLSKVEHDRLTLTYDKLVQLSQRLNI